MIFNYKNIRFSFTCSKKIVIKIRELNDVMLSTTKHLFFNFRVFEQINDSSTIIYFTRHIYIVDELKTKLLLNNDIIDSKHIVFDVEKKKNSIDNCKKLTIKLNIKNVESTINRVTRVNNVIKISIKFNTTISFKLRDKKKLFIDRDFIFVFQRIDRLKIDDDMLSHIIDVHIAIVLIQNINFENVYFFKNNKLKIVQVYEKNDYYLINLKKKHR